MFNRILRVILLLLWLELGLLLILMPWSEVWDVNFFLYQYPALAIFLKNPYLRGMISGLGVMNVLFALEAFRRDGRLPASFEIIYGHAWKPQPRVVDDGRAIVRFDRGPGERR